MVNTMYTNAHNKINTTMHTTHTTLCTQTMSMDFMNRIYDYVVCAQQW